MLPFPQRDILSLVKEIEAAEAPEGQPPFPDGTRFEAPRGTKAGAKLYALFVGASIAVIVLMISLAATVGALKPPLRSTSIVSFLATAFTVSLCWR